MLRALLAATAVSAAAALSSQVLWQAYTGYPTCYRQPLLVHVPPSTLLAFVEGRPGIGSSPPACSGTAWPDTPDFPILVRVSQDGGATFGPSVNITNGNLDFLTVVRDATTNTILLQLQLGDNGIIQTSSSDNGSTWSTPVPVVIPNTFASLIPGVGHGLQVDPAFCLDPTCGGTAGRLILPFVCTDAGPVTNDTACGNCRTCLVYSDDVGASWQLGAVSSQQGSREAALVQLNSADYASVNAVIYAAERNLGNQTGMRWHAVSRNGGYSFDPAGYGVDSSLPDVVTSDWTGCVSGFTRYDPNPAVPASPWLVFTAPAAVGQRANFSAFTSRDNGRSWSGGQTLWADPAAYSDSLQLNSTHIALVVENGQNEFAQQISFMLLTAGDLPTPP